jgi:dipeptidase D
MEMEGLVETSANLGSVKLKKKNLVTRSSVRSSVTTRKADVVNKISLLNDMWGGELNLSGDYPAWEYRKESPLRELFAVTYQELFHTKPMIYSVHAGLECALFSKKIEDLDCISIGPNMYDIHTPQERLSISSTERTWQLLTAFLEKAK